MPTDANRVKDILVAALQKTDPAERAAFLAEACGPDPEIRQRVEALLRASEDPASFLDGPNPVPPLAGTMPTVSGADVSPDMEGHGRQAAGEEVGSVIAGRYKLLQEIAEGGMGTVWMAEQTAPVKRLVALKLIKPGMDTKSVLARFEAERQALALMDHPNIAKVHDGGTTAAGRPFFVMELIKGIPLTEYCDSRQLTVRQRLDLFTQICSAVQHAHQKGIIHRDLKPTNVLVTEHDGTPVPKVIDFGLAKALRSLHALTERTLYTAFGAVVGTPLYMAPEQVGINALDVDTRTDIYALGVMLYELLTGTTPLEKKRFKEAAWDEIRRLIREEEPPRPSTRLSTSDTLAGIAARRQVEPAQLGKIVRGELDWIVMRALEKDRTRRYETANGFARDVQHYLADEPVEACPPSATYRLRKFGRKHRGALTTAAAIALLLVAGVAVSTWQAVRATRANRAATAAAAAEAEQRQRAEANERRTHAAADSEKKAKETAETREAETRAVLEFVENKVFAAARPQGQEGGLGHDVTLRRAIEAALQLVERSFRDQPLIEARLRMTLGQSFAYLGEAKLAAEQFQAARTIYTKHCGPDHIDTLASMHNLAIRYYDLGRHADALSLKEETLVLCKAKLGPDHPHTLMSMHSLANSYAALGRHADALQLREETLPLLKAKLGPDHPDTLGSMNNLANSYRALGRHAEALKLNEETLALRKAKLGPDHPDTLVSMNNLATIYTAFGRHADALNLREETLALRKAKLGPDHPDTLLTMNNLAMLLATASDVKLRDGPRALELAKKVVELSPKEADYWGTYGTAHYRCGDWKWAVANLEKAIGLRTPDDPMNANEGFFLAMTHWQLGDKDKARSSFARAVQWMEKGNPEDPLLKRFRAEAAELLGVKKKA